ncbi:MAG: U32 family peptidase [Bacteroidales bacterium]|nr:U32 family peptidase [Bacteroidales bacterium]
MTFLELLAPARTAEIGKAAIDCGADAVYIAGPAFGARAAAGNSIEDIRELCSYAHRFGVRIYATVNTILYEDELKAAEELVRQLASAGVDALIVQDPVVIEMASKAGLIVHASTQCAIRTPEKARFIESLGYGRLVLERQLSLDDIRAIRKAVSAEIEFFVHGALCVCYSGQCYLSEYLTGRSANRGECAQACRSRYDLMDGSGKVLARDKALLSLKDYNLLHRLEDLANAGVCSFKIEGRLKGESYVRNVITAYSEALNALVQKHPEKYSRASFGRVSGGIAPDLEKTFNRGYTDLFIDGKRGKWSSMDVPTYIGEYAGEVARITADGIVLKSSALDLANGDGFAFLSGNEIVGFRADVAEGLNLRCRVPEELRAGTRLYRNISAKFQKRLEASAPVREIGVSLSVTVSPDSLAVTAVSEDGRKVTREFPAGTDSARDRSRMLEIIHGQLSKRSCHYSFEVTQLQASGTVPFMAASFLNGIRRDIAGELDGMPVNAIALKAGAISSASSPETLSYKANVANSKDRELYSSRGAAQIEDAYEITHRAGAELMRSKYCVRHELGLCPKQGKYKPEPLYLLNAGKRLRLDFHCAECEMTVSDI